MALSGFLSGFSVRKVRLNSIETFFAAFAVFMLAGFDGGLANRSSTAYGLKGVLISPAPFENALDDIAKDLALDAILEEHAGPFAAEFLRENRS